MTRVGVQHPVPRSPLAGVLFIHYLKDTTNIKGKKYSYILGRIFFNKLKKGCVTR